jgi:hypothetical protein
MVMEVSSSQKNWITNKNQKKVLKIFENQQSNKLLTLQSLAEILTKIKLLTTVVVEVIAF